jgi:hypothetical protein
MYRLTRYCEAPCGWVWLGDCGRWQPDRLPAGLPCDPMNPPECGRPAQTAARPWPMRISYCSGTSTAGLDSADQRPTSRVAAQPLSSGESPWNGRAALVTVFIPMAWTVPVPAFRRPAALCDLEGVPRGPASRGAKRYRVRLSVPRRGGWRAWGTVRADFERALADPADPARAVAVRSRLVDSPASPVRWAAELRRR